MSTILTRVILNYPVRILKKSGNHNTQLDNRFVENVTGDLRDLNQMFRVTQGVTHILHCAAALPDNADEDEIWQVNVTGTENLLKAAVEAGVKRFVFVSTDSIYGDGDNIDTTETAPLNPDYYKESNYPSSKLEAEKLVALFHQTQQLPMVIVRPCLIYGPGDSPASIIFKRWANQDTHWLINGGYARLSMVYVEDAARAILLASFSTRSNGQCYNIGGPDYSKREILLAISKITGRKKHFFNVPATLPLLGLSIIHPLIQAARLPFAYGLDPARIMFSINNHVINSSKGARELGYEPRTELNDGIAATLNWLREQQIER